MRIDIRYKKQTKLAMDFKCFNVDTGKEIPKVVFADVAKGEYGQYRLNPDGTIYYRKGMNQLEVITHKGNIELRLR